MVSNSLTRLNERFCAQIQDFVRRAVAEAAVVISAIHKIQAEMDAPRLAS